MRKLACTLLPMLAITVVLGAGVAVAQDNVFALSYYANAHTTGAPDATLRLINDGNVNDMSPAGDLWADVYVFDNNEELAECCSCRVTPNGYLSLSVNNALTSNPLTPRTLHRGVIKVVSSNSGNPAVSSPNIGIRGWLTHIQNNNSGYAITEEELSDSTFGSAEAADLAEDCGVLVELGSGFGICGCGDSGH